MKNKSSKKPKNTELAIVTEARKKAISDLTISAERKEKIGRDLLMVFEAQKKAKEELAKFVQFNSHLFDTVNSVKTQIETFRKFTDFSDIAKRIAEPAKYLSGLSEQIASFSNMFQVSAPSHLEETLGRMSELYKQDGFMRSEVYVPPARNDFDFVQTSLAKFEAKIDRKLDTIEKAIDKNTGSYKIVSDKNAYCQFCGYQLMRVQFMIYFGKATMKCPNCKKVVQIPQQLNFKEIE